MVNITPRDSIRVLLGLSTNRATTFRLLDSFLPLFNCESQRKPFWFVLS